MSESGVREYPADEDMTEGLQSNPNIVVGKVSFGPLDRRVPRMDYSDERHVPKLTEPEPKDPPEILNHVSSPNQLSQRKYLPTLSDLVDRLTIVQLKSVFIPQHKDEYVKERALIEHDIDLILYELFAKGMYIGAKEVHAIIVIMLSNRFIWENESKARAGGSEQDRLLKLTHSINGIRNQAKNQLAHVDGGRKDYKTDCFAAELVEDFGDWNIFV